MSKIREAMAGTALPGHEPDWSDLMQEFLHRGTNPLSEETKTLFWEVLRFNGRY